MEGESATQMEHQRKGHSRCMRRQNSDGRFGGSQPCAKPQLRLSVDNVGALERPDQLRQKKRRNERQKRLADSERDHCRIRKLISGWLCRCSLECNSQTSTFRLFTLQISHIRTFHPSSSSAVESEPPPSKVSNIRTTDEVAMTTLDRTFEGGMGMWYG